MPYNIGGKSALLLIESLPLQQSDRECRGFVRISCSLKLEAQISNSDGITSNPIFSYSFCAGVLFLCTCTYACSIPVTQGFDRRDIFNQIHIIHHQFRKFLRKLHKLSTIRFDQLDSKMQHVGRNSLASCWFSNTQVGNITISIWACTVDAAEERSLHPFLWRASTPLPS